MTWKVFYLFSIIAFYQLYANNNDLIFDDSHSFKIMQLTDIHYGDNIYKDIKNTILIKNLIKYSNPNFVVMTGDTVCSTCSWRPAIPKFISELCWDEFHLSFSWLAKKYAISIGNHDCEGGGANKRKELMEFEEKLSYSYSHSAPKNISFGSTYYIPIYSSFNKSNPAVILWIFDSKDFCRNISSDGCVDTDQIEWFKETEKKLRDLYGEDFISFAFTHIPPPEFLTLYNTGFVYGNRFEGVCCPKINTGFVDALLEKGVKALFVGHDHDNDFGGFYKEIELVYGRKTGYGYYGPSHFERGSRIIELNEKYDPNMNKLFVQYNHYVVDGKGSFIPNGPAYKRNDTIEKCG